MSTTKSSVGRREGEGWEGNWVREKKVVCMYASIFLYTSKMEVNDAPPPKKKRFQKPRFSLALFSEME